MALSWANVTVMYRGAKTMVYGEVTFDSSYAAGGETVNATDVGLTTIDILVPAATRGYNVQYAKTNAAAGTLAIFASATPDTNSATAAPLDSAVARAYSTVSVSCFIIGN